MNGVSAVTRMAWASGPKSAHHPQAVQPRTWIDYVVRNVLGWVGVLGGQQPKRNGGLKSYLPATSQQLFVNMLAFKLLQALHATWLCMVTSCPGLAKVVQEVVAHQVAVPSLSQPAPVLTQGLPQIASVSICQKWYLAFPASMCFTSSYITCINHTCITLWQYEDKTRCTHPYQTFHLQCMCYIISNTICNTLPF